jgi:hypothetical protein
MNRKEFVFIETIVVLVVVMVIMIGIYSSYSIINRNATKREKYDNINDIYKVNLIMSFYKPNYALFLSSYSCS